jgi:hypothetical protein
MGYAMNKISEDVQSLRSYCGSSLRGIESLREACRTRSPNRGWSACNAAVRFPRNGSAREQNFEIPTHAQRIATGVPCEGGSAPRVTIGLKPIVFLIQPHISCAATTAGSPKIARP